MPAPEELMEKTPQARAAAQQERHRPGFEDTVWFRMDIGRRQNADARWILPLICRRGGVTKNEVGAIRIGQNETAFQIPRKIAGKFHSMISTTAEGDDDVRFEPADGPPEGGPRQSRDGPPRNDGPPRGAGNRPQLGPRHSAKPYQKAGPRKGPPRGNSPR